MEDDRSSPSICWLRQHLPEDSFFILWACVVQEEVCLLHNDRSEDVYTVNKTSHSALTCYCKARVIISHCEEFSIIHCVVVDVNANQSC